MNLGTLLVIALYKTLVYLVGLCSGFAIVIWIRSRL